MNNIKEAANQFGKRDIAIAKLAMQAGKILDEAENTYIREFKQKRDYYAGPLKIKKHYGRTD